MVLDSARRQQTRCSGSKKNPLPHDGESALEEVVMRTNGWQRYLIEVEGSMLSLRTWPSRRLLVREDVENDLADALRETSSSLVVVIGDEAWPERPS